MKFMLGRCRTICIMSLVFIPNSCVRLPVSVCLSLCMTVYVSTDLHLCVSICLSVCVCVHMHVCVLACMCVCALASACVLFTCVRLHISRLFVSSLLSQLSRAGKYMIAKCSAAYMYIYFGISFLFHHEIHPICVYYHTKFDYWFPFFLIVLMSFVVDFAIFSA